MEKYYLELARPSWAPPAWVFGPVWSVLYVFIAVSFGAVLYLWFRKRIPTSTLVPFVLNLACNVAFTWIQFGLKSNVLASIDVMLVLGTLIWAMAAVWGRVRWIAYAQIPYLVWVTFASVLQLSITVLNR